MSRVPAWAWALLALVVIVGVGYRGILRAEYFKGIADAAAEEARAQTELVTEAGARSDSLAAELEQLGAELLEHAREDSLRLRGGWTEHELALEFAATHSRQNSARDSTRDRSPSSSSSSSPIASRSLQSVKRSRSRPRAGELRKCSSHAALGSCSSSAL